MSTTPPPAGFTPGPWTAIARKPNKGEPDGCAMVRIEGGSMAADFACSGLTRDEDRANARLAAAAPDLYAALLRLVNEPGINQDDLPSVDEAIADARAAIAKAGGGE